MEYCFAERRVLKFQQSHFLSGFLHSYSQLTSRVTSISENEMNMFKIIFKCRTLQFHFLGNTGHVRVTWIDCNRKKYIQDTWETIVILKVYMTQNLLLAY